MQGSLDFLVSSAAEAQALRSIMVFKLVPMLNPDGVINGNYRCGLAGYDLNRQWDKPSPTLHPTIFHVRALVQSLSAAGRLSLFVDMHGHSMRESAFFFGCDPIGTKPGAEGAERRSADRARLRIRMLPFLFGKREPLFSFKVRSRTLTFVSPLARVGSHRPGCAQLWGSDALTCAGQKSACNACHTRITPPSRLQDSSFRVFRGKASAGRVVVAREFGLVGSYTLETSLAGDGPSRQHHTIPDLLRIGSSLCYAIMDLATADAEAVMADMASGTASAPGAVASGGDDDAAVEGATCDLGAVDSGSDEDAPLIVDEVHTGS